MINFKPIELSDKSLFDEYFNSTPYNNAEKNFSNIFMWRHTYEYSYAMINKCLCIKGKLRKTKEPFCHFPYGKCSSGETIKLLKQAFKEEGESLILKPVLAPMKEFLEEMMPNEFKIYEDRDSFDYIYKSNKLIELSGGKLRNKRRWVKKFTNNYNYAYEAITEDNIQESKEFVINNIKESSADYNVDEAIAMEEMFDNMFELGITGFAVRVDGKIVAVSTGEQLTDDTVVIHCERGDKKYMGVYNYINQEFAKSEWSDYKYINREEDLGIEGLRSSKMTYQPDNLLSKYIAKIEV